MYIALALILFVFSKDLAWKRQGYFCSYLSQNSRHHKTPLRPNYFHAVIAADNKMQYLNLASYLKT